MSGQQLLIGEAWMHQALRAADAESAAAARSAIQSSLAATTGLRAQRAARLLERAQSE